MNLTPDKSHLTALDILLELRCWLADNVEMQAEPAIVAIDALLHQLRH